jgi:hypothetical protein
MQWDIPDISNVIEGQVTVNITKEKHKKIYLVKIEWYRTTEDLFG